ncbi:deoxynucleoside triphosphate triphosphohydrolase SAMHD1-like [Teleopsis dalmanni]|uniref:deoxynucleoside triphosphate triphosphohydrolase SAMHD1-like n=1 Tax=Teleopsis dalmanni TaxID=139649 RepID=UPI0018CCD17E|nr:deoxynucleoside triphosphate triphosphohydrolase SAMHD1-like [Teleopsis dalmanni]
MCGKMLEIADPVHGQILLPYDIVQIINTPQFQRLKNIKQLGVMFVNKPETVHTRYDHCIGTYWASKRMLNKLEINSKWITKDKDWPVYRLSVEIAGLLHDIGHGPFSHAWETVVENYNHEWNALPCVNAIFRQLDSSICNNLRANRNFGIELIKALIVGEPKLLSTPMPEQYLFVFEIVNNKQCSLDVDKWDYLNRDHHCLKEFCNPDMNFIDVFLNAAVTDDGKHIQYRYEDYDKIYKLFTARFEFHLKAYRMQKNLACDYVLRKIIMDNNFKIDKKDITEITARDMDLFLKFTDDCVFDLIKDTVDFNYFKYPKQIELVDSSQPYDFILNNAFKGPGEEMPPDTQFHFYGDISKKASIKRDTKGVNEMLYFKFDKSIL